MYINLYIILDSDLFKVPNENPFTLDNHHVITQLISNGQIQRNVMNKFW